MLLQEVKTKQKLIGGQTPPSLNSRRKKNENKAQLLNFFSSFYEKEIKNDKFLPKRVQNEFIF